MLKITSVHYLSTCLFLFFAINVTAQETVKLKEFKFKKINEKTPCGYLSTLNNVVFIENTSSKEENHKKILSHIESRYEYPEDVILSDVPNEIVIQEQISSLLSTVSLGYMSSFNMKYNLTFRITDGEIKCTLSNIQSGNSLISNSWKDFSGLCLHRKNGKPRKTMFGITDVKIENHFNNLIKSIDSF